MLPDTRPPIQLQQLPRRKKPALKRASLFLGLVLGLIGLVLTMSGCSAADAAQDSASPADLKRAAAGAWLCPGMHAQWLSDTQVQCLKERP